MEETNVLGQDVAPTPDAPNPTFTGFIKGVQSNPGQTITAQDVSAYGLTPEEQSYAQKMNDLLPESKQLGRTDIYPGIDQPVNIGTYQGQTFSAPIFAATGGYIPVALWNQRKEALRNAAMMNMKAKQLAFNVKPPDTYPLYQQKLNESFYNGLEKFSELAELHGTAGYMMLQDKSTTLGRNFAKYLDNYNTVARDINSLTALADEIRKKHEDPNAYLMPETVEAFNKILDGVDEMQGKVLNQPDIVDMMSKLKSYASLEAVLDPMFKNLQKDITSYVSKYTAGSTEYYDALQEITTEKFNNAKSLAEYTKKQYNLPQDVSFIQKHIEDMIGDTKKSNLVIAYKDKGSNGHSKTEVTYAFNSIINKAKELSIGNGYERGKNGSSISFGRDAFTYRDANGTVNVYPLSDTKRISTAMTEFYSQDPSRLGITGTFPSSEVSAEFDNPELFTTFSNSIKQADTAVTSKEIDSIKTSSPVQIVNWATNHLGYMPINSKEKYLIKGAIQNSDKTWNFKIDAGGTEENGVFLPEGVLKTLTPTDIGYLFDSQGGELISSGAGFRFSALGKYEDAGNGMLKIKRSDGLYVNNQATGKMYLLPKSMVVDPVTAHIDAFKNQLTKTEQLNKTTGETKTGKLLSGRIYQWNDLHSEVTLNDLSKDWSGGSHKDAIFDGLGREARTIAALYLKYKSKKVGNRYYSINDAVQDYNLAMNSGGLKDDIESQISEVDKKGDTYIHSLFFPNTK